MAQITKQRYVAVKLVIVLILCLKRAPVLHRVHKILVW